MAGESDFLSWFSYQFSHNYFDSNLSCRNILHSSRLIFLLVNSVLWYFGRVCSWCVWLHGILGSCSESAVWLIYLSKQLRNPESPTTSTQWKQDFWIPWIWNLNSKPAVDSRKNFNSESKIELHFMDDIKRIQYLMLSFMEDVLMRKGVTSYGAVIDIVEKGHA